MKKFILVVFIGLVLAINVYGVVETIKDYLEGDVTVEVDKGYTTVYME